jgi:hypothetical protein
VRKPRRRPPPRLTGALRERAESVNLCADARRSIVSKFKIDGGAGEPSNSAMQFLFRVQAAAPITAKAVHAKSYPRRRGEQRPGVGSVEEKEVSSTIENLTDMLTDATIYRFRRGEGLTPQVCEPSSSRSRYTGAIDTRQILRCRDQRSLIAQTVVKISVKTFWPRLMRQTVHDRDRDGTSP